MTGAEISQHMCDVAAEAVVMNGYAAKCVMINKDVRRIHSETLPDGTLPDMEYKANLCIFEVCACAGTLVISVAGYLLRNRAEPRIIVVCVSYRIVPYLTVVTSSCVFMCEKATPVRHLLVQVFDSGLIGEGVLHMVAWAKTKLLTEDAVMVSHVHQLSSHTPPSACY